MIAHSAMRRPAAESQSPETLAAIAAAYAAGVSLRRLRTIHRCGTPTVMYALEQHGVEHRGGERWDDSWTPTPAQLEEIEQRKAEVRSRWSREERMARECRTDPAEWSRLLAEEAAK